MSLKGFAAPLTLERPNAAPAQQWHAAFGGQLSAVVLGGLCTPGSVECSPGHGSGLPAAGTGTTWDAFVQHLGDAVGAHDGLGAHATAPVAWAYAAAGVEPPRAVVLQEMAAGHGPAAQDASLVETVSTYVQQVPEPGGVLAGLGMVAALVRRRGGRQRVA